MVNEDVKSFFKNPAQVDDARPVGLAINLRRAAEQTDMRLRPERPRADPATARARRSLPAHPWARPEPLSGGAEGNRTSRSTALGTRGFTYDNIYQLDQVTTEAGQAGFSSNADANTVTLMDFDFDGAGNRDQVTTSFTGLSNLVQDYSANSSNELVLAAGVTQSFDGNGNLIGRGTRSFAWDHRNRLTGVNDSGSGLDWDADYDHNDRIYKRVVDGVQYDLIYDDFGRLLAEIKVNPSGADELMASYLWDGIGLAAEKRGGQVRYPVYDGLGTVQLWLDEEGEVLEAPRFDEWGVPTVTSASPFGYTGRWGGYADAATGDVLNWHRWYGPMQGNWLSRDPIGVMGGENVYGYVGNNPVNGIDPLGLVTFSFGGYQSAGAVVGGGKFTGFVLGYSRSAGFQAGIITSVQGGAAGGLAHWFAGAGASVSSASDINQLSGKGGEATLSGNAPGTLAVVGGNLGGGDGYVSAGGIAGLGNSVTPINSTGYATSTNVNQITLGDLMDLANYIVGRNQGTANTGGCE